MWLVDLENRLKDVFIRGMVRDRDVSLLEGFCGLVYGKHFMGYRDSKDDIMQEGLLGLISLINLGIYDSDRSALNFAYSRVRNKMGLFVKKNKPVSFSNIGLKVEFVKGLVNVVEYDDVEERVYMYVKKLGLVGNMQSCILVYFSEKFGFGYDSSVRSFDVDSEFVVRYRFYKNFIEYSLVKLGSEFLDRVDMKGILDKLVVRRKGRFELLLNMFSDEELFMLMYVFEGMSIKFPAIGRLLKAFKLRENV